MNKAKEIFEKIKKKEIEPKSKWRFLVKDYLIWVFFGLSILVGAMAFSVIIFLLNDNDWDIYKYLDKSFASYILLSLPYIWIIVLLLFSFLAYFNYRHTKTGYKVNPIVIVLVSVLISVFFGGLLFTSGFGRAIDITLSERIPYYEEMLRHRKAVWNNPEKGLLAGRITKIKNRNNFRIKSLKGEEWQILGGDIYWRGPVSQEIGMRIKIIGIIKEDNVFEAQEIRPWIGMGKGMHRGMQSR